jgi:hypothetical protein
MDARRSFYLNSDHDDHAELTAKADRSNAVAIPYVTPANDNVPTSLRLRAHCRFGSSFSCRRTAAILELRHDVIRDGVALTPPETIS